MHNLFEESDSLNTPIECFIFDAAKEVFPVKPHYHYFMEIIYMLNGTAEMFADGQQFILKSGDVILFYPKTVHSIYSVNHSLPRYAVLKFDINTLRLTYSYTPKLRSVFHTAEKQGMNLFFPNGSNISQCASEMFGYTLMEMREKEYGFDIAIKSAIYKLLIQIIREWKISGFSVDSNTFAEDEHYDIYNITEYIDEHMNNGIRVLDIAKQCGMSYSYFAKRFTATYGKTCKEYIDAMRLYKAEEFLIFTDFDLNYISQETGFSDCSHFIKSFRNAKGITPKQFRSQHIREQNPQM